MSLRSLYKSCPFGMESTRNFAKISHGVIELLDTDPKWYSHIHTCPVCKNILKKTRDIFTEEMHRFSHQEIEAILDRLDSVVHSLYCHYTKKELREVLAQIIGKKYARQEMYDT